MSFSVPHHMLTFLPRVINVFGLELLLVKNTKKQTAYIFDWLCDLNGTATFLLSKVSISKSLKHLPALGRKRSLCRR